jgi:putative PIN family toxin of toxin-antitoxin system
MRVVLDTNVLVAAFATRGLCEDVFRAVLAEHELVVSDPILAELERVLVDKLGLPRPRASAITKFVHDQADIAEPLEPASWPENDPDDRWIVATALVGKADVLVTGDRDLLEVRDVAVAVVTPRGFWERLR